MPQELLAGKGFDNHFTYQEFPHILRSATPTAIQPQLKPPQFSNGF
jgi:hypothetical protein